METIDPKELTSQHETKKLLEKAKVLREKSKITAEKLSQLQQQGEKFKEHEAEKNKEL